MAPAEDSDVLWVQSILAGAGGLLALAADIAAVAQVSMVLGGSGRRGALAGGAVICAAGAVLVMLLVATLLNKPPRLVLPLRGIWFLSWAILLAAAIMMFFGPRLGL